MPHIIAFTGRAGAGKTTAARRMRHLVDYNVHGVRAQVLAFADPLRAAVNAVFPHLGPEAFLENKNEPIPSMPGWSGRRILQMAGTDWFRSMDRDVWIKNMEYRMRRYPGEHDYVFVDDVRFPNEAQLIQSLGGKVYRLHRPSHSPLEGDAATHASEAFVDNLVVDGDIDNTGTLEEFERVITALWENHR